MFLGEGIEDGALGLARARQIDIKYPIGAAEERRDDAVLALIDRRRPAFAAHRPVDGLDRQLAQMGGRVGLPARNLALAGLAGGEGQMHRVLQHLIDDFGLQPQQRADARRDRRAEMGDMVDLVFMQAHRHGEIDVDLVRRGDGADQVGAAPPALLGDGDQGRDVVAGMGRFGGEESVVEIELAHRRGVGPARPLGLETLRTRQAEHRRPALAGMGQRLGPRIGDRPVVDRRHGDGGVIDDAVDHHPRHFRPDGRRIGGDRGDLPGELRRPLGRLGGRVDPDFVADHDSLIALFPGPAVNGSAPIPEARLSPAH